MEIDQNIRLGKSHFERRKGASFYNPRLFVEYGFLNLYEFLLIPLLSAELKHMPVKMVYRNV